MEEDALLDRLTNVLQEDLREKLGLRDYMSHPQRRRLVAKEEYHIVVFAIRHVIIQGGAPLKYELIFLNFLLVIMSALILLFLCLSTVSGDQGKTKATK